MDDTILVMSNISKQFSGITVLDNVNFSLSRGEVHVLIGENGAGKSTLMKILTGVYQADSGQISMLDKNDEFKSMHFKNPKDAIDRGISMVFQESNLMENLSIAENIYVGREPTKKGFVDFEQMFKDADEQLKLVSLDIPSTRIVNSLTIAQKQCVEIAKCLSYNARIIILDEPTSALSEKEVKTLFKIIKKLKRQSIGVIYISHRMEEIFEIGDRITVLRDGQYIGTVSADETQENELIKMMIGREFENNPLMFDSNECSEVVIECKNLLISKFNEKVDFQARAGEIVGIFGLIGAGRTELARIFFGIDPIQKGCMYIHNKKVEIDDPSSAIKHRIGLIPEDRKLHGLNLQQDIRDNVSLIKLSEFRWILPTRRQESSLTEKYMKLLSIVAPSQRQKVTNLSGGNQQKVVIAKWLTMNMDVLILDEPTRGIDVGAKAEIYDIIRDLARQGKCILMISSDLPEILRVSQRIVVMHDGKITLDTLNNGLNQEIIMQAALG
ncbi:MAG: sugar ABC transporter ATP-binding protein [Anaerolineaceae bacterium]